MNAAACLSGFCLVGWILPHLNRLYESLRLQLPALTVATLSPGAWAWFAMGIGMAVAILAKDLLCEEKQSSLINQIAVPLVLLGLLVAVASLLFPFLVVYGHVHSPVR